MTGEDEPDRAGSPLQQTERRKRRERPGLEVLHQEADGKVRGDPGHDAPSKDLHADPVAQGSEQFWELVHPRRQDDGGGQQKREPRSILMREPAPSSSTSAVWTPPKHWCPRQE